MVLSDSWELCQFIVLDFHQSDDLNMSEILI